MGWQNYGKGRRTERLCPGGGARTSPIGGSAYPIVFFGGRLEKYALGRDAGGARSVPDRLLAGVRPVRVSRAVNARPSAGEVGEPAAVQLGFDDHGLGKLNTHYFNPHTDLECARRINLGSVALRLVVYKAEQMDEITFGCGGPTPCRILDRKLPTSG